MKQVISAIFITYKRWVSPALPNSCRFTPTCSEYAAVAVERHGVAAGLLLTCWRLLRCHPFSRAGFDPVPLPRTTHLHSLETR